MNVNISVNEYESLCFEEAKTKYLKADLDALPILGLYGASIYYYLKQLCVYNADQQKSSYFGFQFYCSNEKLAQRFCCSESTIKREIKKLQELGLIQSKMVSKQNDLRQKLYSFIPECFSNYNYLVKQKQLPESKNFDNEGGRGQIDLGVEVNLTRGTGQIDPLYIIHNTYNNIKDNNISFARNEISGESENESPVNQSKNSEFKNLEYENIFNEFWNTYNRKQSKQSAIKKFNSMSKGLISEMMDRLPEYMAGFPEEKFRPNPDRFLTGKRWNDLPKEGTAESNKLKVKVQETKDANFLFLFHGDSLETRSSKFNKWCNSQLGKELPAKLKAFGEWLQSDKQGNRFTNIHKEIDLNRDFRTFKAIQITR